MKVYATLWRVGFQDAIQYRAEGFIWFLFDVIPPLMMLAFWNTAYEATSSVAGYTLPAMLAYTIGVMVLRNLVSSHVEWDIDYCIRQGALSNYLVRPINVWVIWLLPDSAWRVWRTLMVSPLLVLAIVTLAPTLERPPTGTLELGALVLSLALAYLICFILKLCLGCSGFWLTDVGSVALLYEVLVYLFGGILIPLDLLPEIVQTIARLLPFQYIYSFPLSVLLGRTQGMSLLAGLLVQVVWLLALLALARGLWRAGLTRYEAVGG